MGKNCGQEMKRTRGHKGAAEPLAMVVTLTVTEPLPDASMLGVTVQVVVVVTATGRVHDKLTCDEKPF
jgi:hypothetical protein